MEAGSNGSVVAAKRTLLKTALIYAVLIGVWVLIQSGIPFAPFVNLKVESSTWLQTLNAWFFVVCATWLLYLLIYRGLSVLESTQEALRLRDRAIEASGSAIFITNCLRPDNPIEYVNPAFERITGHTAAEAIGRNPRFLQGTDMDQPELEGLRLALREHRECRVVLRNYRRDGRLYWNDLYVAPVRNEQGSVTHYVGVQNDITDAKRYEEQLARHANYDSLTGLPNRNLLSDRINSAIERAKRDSTSSAIAFVDVDKLRVVNDSLGHNIGDQLLRAVAKRLGSCLRTADTVARHGGDDFVLVLGDQADERSISEQMQRIAEAFAKPFRIAGRDLFISLSIGVALYPHDGADVESLIKNAESAMYLAMERGGNTFRLFTAEMNERVSERLDLDGKLRRALERGEFLLHYQPQIDLRSNRIIGAEALLRWMQPQLGMVPPAKFIPLAEETGLIVPIGEWVLRTACAQCKSWRDMGLPQITIAVNISARQFGQTDLVRKIGEILLQTGLEPRHLELEVTESAVMHNPQEAIATLQALKSMGLQLAIDDFGTGYSSLSYLKRFPVDRLKIDQSFVREITTDADDAAIAQAVITLGHSMNLKVLAEGVETREQLAFLRANGCDEKQGFFFSKPLPAKEIEILLREGRMLAAG